MAASTTPPASPRSPSALSARAMMVGAATLGSRLLGFLRDVALAAALGAGPAVDVFFALFRIPLLARRLFAEGALSLALTPPLTRRLAKEDGGEAASRTAMAFAAAAGLVAALLLTAAALAPDAFTPLIALLAPGYMHDQSLMDDAMDLLGLMLIYLALAPQLAVGAAWLHARHRFAAAALAPCIFNTLLILGCVGAWRLGWEASHAVAAAAAAAGTVQALALYACAHRASLRLGALRRMSLRVIFLDEGMRRMVRGLAPAVVGASPFQLMLLLATPLATLTAAGEAAALYYAERLVLFPLGVVGAAVGVAALPTLAAAHVDGDHHAFADTLAESLRLVLFLAMPAATGLIALSEPLALLLFARGAFDAADAAAVSPLLDGFALGLPALATSRVLASGLFAQDAGGAAMRAALWGVGGFVLMGPLAVWLGGGFVLAAAAAAAAWLVCVLQWRLLWRQGVAPSASVCFGMSAKPTALALVMGALVWWLHGLAPVGAWSVLIAVAAGALGYLAGARLWGVDESRRLFRRVRRS